MSAQALWGVSILRTGPDRRTGSFCLAINVIGLFYGPEVYVWLWNQVSSSSSK